jgi:hypothetical protein
MSKTTRTYRASWQHWHIDRNYGLATHFDADSDKEAKDYLYNHIEHHHGQDWRSSVSFLTLTCVTERRVKV